MEAELGQIVEKKNKTHKLNLKVSRALWSGNHPEQAAISHLQQINPSLAGPGRGGLKSDVCARHLANRPEVFKSFLEDVAQGFSFEAELDKLDLKLIDPMHPTRPLGPLQAQAQEVTPPAWPWKVLMSSSIVPPLSTHFLMAVALRRF